MSKLTNFQPVQQTARYKALIKRVRKEWGITNANLDLAQEALVDAQMNGDDAKEARIQAYINAVADQDYAINASVGYGEYSSIEATIKAQRELNKLPNPARSS